MKNPFLLVFYLSALFILGSCNRFTFEKRRYERGFYVHQNEKIKQGNKITNTASLLSENTENLKVNQALKIPLQKKSISEQHENHSGQIEKILLKRPYAIQDLKPFVQLKSLVKQKSLQKFGKAVTRQKVIGLLGFIFLAAGLALISLGDSIALSILFIAAISIVIGTDLLLYSRHLRKKENEGDLYRPRPWLWIALGLFEAIFIFMLYYLAIYLPEN